MSQTSMNSTYTRRRRHSQGAIVPSDSKRGHTGHEQATYEDYGYEKRHSQGPIETSYSNPLTERPRAPSNHGRPLRASQRALTRFHFARSYGPRLAKKRSQAPVCAQNRRYGADPVHTRRGDSPERAITHTANECNMWSRYHADAVWWSRRRHWSLRPGSGGVGAGEARTETRKSALHIPGHHLLSVLHQNLKSQGVTGVTLADPSDGYSVKNCTWTWVRALEGLSSGSPDGARPLRAPKLCQKTEFGGCSA